MLGATRRVVIATGILNLWMHEPAEVATQYASLTATHGDRFLLGIGVSHAPLIDAADPGRYRKPLAATSSYLDALDAAEQPVPVDARVLAALGPKLLQLAATRARGAHPYLVTPDHTAQARETLGEGPLLPEQTVILTLQNGLGNEEFLAQNFDAERILGGICFICLKRTEPGVIERLDAGRLTIGEFHGHPSPRLHDIAWDFKRCGIVCRVTEIGRASCRERVL